MERKSGFCLTSCTVLLLSGAVSAGAQTPQAQPPSGAPGQPSVPNNFGGGGGQQTGQGGFGGGGQTGQGGFGGGGGQQPGPGGFGEGGQQGQQFPRQGQIGQNQGWQGMNFGGAHISLTDLVELLEQKQAAMRK